MRSLFVLGSFAVPARVNLALPASRSLAPRCRYYATKSNHDDGWEVVIGLEIHAQLKTGRKLFSNARIVYGAPVNSQVEPNDAAFPGSLPSLDLVAIKLSVMTALALQCTINPRSTFDRKHYFYKDIPASYQITQHYNPLARSGHLKIDKGDNGSQRDLVVGIQQLQVEQDTAKSQVVGDNSLIDLNRAGMGLMEIVTDPDMRSAEEAGAFVKKLQSLLRRIGSGDGDMEKGNLRVDANISVHRPGTPFGTRSEIKNLNSVRFLQQAIEYERSRHIEHYTTNPTIPLPQETRTLNELTGQTYALRTKEDAQDYRYMPDPNLPAMAVQTTYIEHLKSSLPELPGQTVHRLIEQYGVPKKEVETLIGLDEYRFRGVAYFEQVSQGDIDLGKRALNLIVHEILGNLNKKNQAWTPDLIPASLMREVAAGVESRYITGTTGKAVLKHLLDHSEPTSPSTTLSEILDHLGMTPSTSASDDLRIQCEQVIADSPGVVGDIRKGKISAVGRLVGQVMRVSKGSADAQKAREVILEILGATP